MRRVVVAISGAFCALGVILPVVVMLIGAASAAHLRLSASVRADLSAGQSGAPAAEPHDYTLVAESAEAASRIAEALRLEVPGLDYRDGRVLSISSAQIARVVGAI